MQNLILFMFELWDRCSNGFNLAQSIILKSLQPFHQKYKNKANARKA